MYTLTFKNPLKDKNTPRNKDYDENYALLKLRFNKALDSLHASLKPKKKLARCGKLVNSRLYQYAFTNPKIFTKVNSKFEKFSTTFIFLVDISGSMSATTRLPFGGKASRLDVSKCIMKALADATKEKFKNKINIEILLKSDCLDQVEEYGKPVFLSRVFSSKTNDSKIIDTIGFENCYSVNADPTGGSATPEFLIAKGVEYFITNFVKTKDVIVFNLTDGEAYSYVGFDGQQLNFGPSSNDELLKKYGNRFKIVSFMIGNKTGKYPNPIVLENNFGGQMLTVFNKILRGE